MTPRIAFLAFFLSLAHLQAATPEGVAVGSIVTVSGSISSIDANAGSFTIDPGKTFFVTSNSILTVNGKRGNMSDLSRGMKVTGSAEVGKAESRSALQKKFVRMMAAVTDPSYVPPRAPSAFPAPFQVPPQMPGMPFPGMPSARGDADGIKKKLSGTFWTVPDPALPGGAGGTKWLSLNEDGTVNSSGSEKPGTWRVMIGSMVQVFYFYGERPVTSMITFNPEMNKGNDMRFGRMGPMAESSAWTLIATPTPEMLAKVPQRPGSPASGVAAAPNPSAETQQAASAIVKANHNNLVFVTGKEGAGSGFIASLGGENYLFTNAHVAAGINDADFKTLDGTVVQRGAAGVAVGHDICRMAFPKGGTPFEIMERVDENAGIGDDVVVLGNAEGSGVINTLMGKIVGIGPNLVEIDSQFVPGNSGSPIVHLKTGKVIGVATYSVTRKYDATTREKMKEPIVRRFGYRIDSVKTWQPVNWQSFYAQAASMERIHTLTEALDNFFRDLYENKSHVTASRHSNPVIKTRISQWQESKSHKLSATDRESADANFISFLKVACQMDLADVQRSLTYDYFQRRLTDEQGTRNEMAKAFSEIIRNIRE